MALEILEQRLALRNSAENSGAQLCSLKRYRQVSTLVANFSEKMTELADCRPRKRETVRPYHVIQCLLNAQPMHRHPTYMYLGCGWSVTRQHLARHWTRSPYWRASHSPRWPRGKAARFTCLLCKHERQKIGELHSKSIRIVRKTI
jgi:hypothetical protein